MKIETDKIEAKTMEFAIKEEDFLETASEIKFKTLFLDKFPIKYRNFSKNIQAERISNIGVAEVDFGFEKLNNVQVKLLEYPKFKMIEFRKRDFKVALGVNTEGTIFLRSNDLFEYEIFENIKNNRLKYILKFFINLFSGTTIKFHLSNIVCDIDFVNHIESFKFNNILEVLENYENLVKVYGLNRNKDLASTRISFYSLLLLGTELTTKSVDTWINLKIDKPENFNVGDNLILKRLHKFNLKNLPFDLLERIEVKNSIKENELINSKIHLNRKTVKITLEKV